MRNQIYTGLDVLVKEGFSRLKNMSVAILANQASVDKNINHIVDLAMAAGVRVVKLFAPEHGIFGAMQDMEHVGHHRDPRYGLPVVSLYGDHKESLTLSAKHLEGVDVLLCDLQDIGSRYYTFHCTIAWAMTAAEQSGTKLMVIDRPNPIGAHTFEGNLVKEPCFSFVGAYPLLNRHGFTMGELVGYVKETLSRSFELEVVLMENYERHTYLDQLPLPYVSPSPNMPSVNAALVYPGLCLIEGTNMSEGRGTCTPFELIGAPYIDNPYRFMDTIESFGFEGVKLRPATFVPKFQKHANNTCHGIFVHITDRERFKPLRFAVGAIKAAMDFKGFDWRREPYEYETNRLAIDLLLGDRDLRLMLEREKSLDELFAHFDDIEKAFMPKRELYMIYSNLPS